jgi:hypothetical protein
MPCHSIKKLLVNGDYPSLLAWSLPLSPSLQVLDGLLKDARSG